MFLGHFAVGFAGRHLTPGVSLGMWFLSVQLVDLVWPLFLLTGREHVRIASGITAFTPLDFYDYPITHSLVSGVIWALLLAVFSRGIYRDKRAVLFLAGGVLSHWFLDVLAHRPDMPVFPNGPYVGLGLWHSIPATLAVELTMFTAALLFYVRGARRTGMAFWAMIAVLLVSYAGAAFGPPPPDVATLAFSALALWLFVVWGWWVDRPRPADGGDRRRVEPRSRI